MAYAVRPLVILLTVGVFAQMIMTAGRVAAEVLEVSEGGFYMEVTRTVPVTPAVAYGQVLRVGEWWNASHTWFGRAENLMIEPEAGGCFCERSGDRSHLHMLVSHVDPGVQLSLLGGLGPLQAMSVQGVMDWKFEPMPDGTTRIVHSYRVSGYTPAGLTKIAPVVDQVLTEQVDRLRRKLSH